MCKFVSPERIFYVITLGALSLFQLSVSYAVEVNAREYNQLPDNLTLVVQYFDYDTMELEGAESNKLDTYVGLFRFIHVLPLHNIAEGLTTDPQIIIPFGSLNPGGDLDGVPGFEDTTDMGDILLFTATKYPINKEKRHFIGHAPILSVPTGSYDKNQVVNWGNNRWAFTNQFAWTSEFLSEKLTMDIDYDFTYYGDNNDLGPAGQTLEQDILHHLQFHWAYDVTPALALTTSYHYLWGGETTIDGVDQDNDLDTHKWRVGFQYFTGSKTQVVMQYGQDYDVNSGQFESDHHFRLRFLYIF